MNTANYVAAVLSGIGTDPNRVVFHQPDGRTITAAEATELIHRFAHVLRGRGIRRGSTKSHRGSRSRTRGSSGIRSLRRARRTSRSCSSTRSASC